MTYEGRCDRCGRVRQVHLAEIGRFWLAEIHDAQLCSGCYAACLDFWNQRTIPETSNDGPAVRAPGESRQ